MAGQFEKGWLFIANKFKICTLEKIPLSQHIDACEGRYLPKFIFPFFECDYKDTEQNTLTKEYFSSSNLNEYSTHYAIQRYDPQNRL